MAKIGMDELVRLLEGPERPTPEFVFGRRVFFRRMEPPGQTVTDYQVQNERNLLIGNVDSLSDTFWQPTGSRPFWRRDGIANDKFWGV